MLQSLLRLVHQFFRDLMRTSDSLDSESKLQGRIGHPLGLFAINKKNRLGVLYMFPLNILNQTNDLSKVASGICSMWIQFETQAHPGQHNKHSRTNNLIPDRTRPDMGRLDIPIGISNSGPVVLGF